MRRFLVVILMAFNALPVFCDVASDALQAKLTGIRTLNASFTQVVKVKQRELTRSSGTMALSRPGHLRWETKAPMEQLIIADGQRVWIYDVDLEQVSVKKQQGSLGETAALFLNQSNQRLTKDFLVAWQSLAKEDRFELKARSKQANFQQVILVFQGERLKEIDLNDQLGQHTEIVLDDIQVNQSLPASLFKFQRPKGVDWLEEE